MANSKSSFWMVATAVVTIGTTLTSCQTATLGVIYNSGESPVTVSYSMNRFGGTEDGSAGCPLDYGSQQPMIQQGSARGRLGVQHWEEIAAYRSDDGPCDVRFDLPPDHSARVFTIGLCEDYQRKYRDGADLKPLFESLTVRGPGVELEFAGWETPLAFRRISRNLCLLEVP